MISSMNLIFVESGYCFENPTSALNERSYESHEKHFTFDDGLKDHFNAAKILQNLGVTRAAFYIPTLPFDSGEILAVHKAQFIRSKFGGDSLKLLEDAENALGLQLIDYKKYSLNK